MKTLKKHQTWINLALFENPADSRVVQLFLAGKRIEARTYNDRFLQLFLFLCPPRLTWRLQVRAGSLKATKEMLSTTPPEALANAVHCPSCGSLDVNYPQMTRKFFTPTLLLHLGIIFRIIDHECYCDSCHYTWNLPKAPKVHFAAAEPSAPSNH
jgi:hypothetical protein